MSSFDDMDAFEGASLSARAMAAAPAPYLDGLNPAQRQAVETLDGPVLMLAGAGTGKTRALTARIAHLLMTRTAQPNEILAVTFTNKAAREMKDRVGQMLGHAAEGMPWLGTFHAICVKLLRRHAELIGIEPEGDLITGARDRIHLKSNFTILDTDDQLRLLKQLVQAANIDDKRWPARQLASIIDGWKNRALTPEKVPAADAGAYNNKGVELYAQYQRRLIELNAVDFGDLLLHMLTIFQTHEDVLTQYQRWFRYILVDEYQDTNVAQYMWLRLLAGSHKNICCVGDDDQSIYGWRGAEVGNILRFEKDFPGAHVVRLEQNYRSTPHILAAASGVIRGNTQRLGKELWTEKKEGEKIRLIGHWDGEEEARWIGEEIEAMQGGTRGIRPISLNEIAILVRTVSQIRLFEDRFMAIGLPYRVYGGARFYERTEIRDSVAYLKVVVSPDNDLAFERIINTPKRGVGPKTLQSIQQLSRDERISLVEATSEAIDRDEVKGKAAFELRNLLESIMLWRRQLLSDGVSHVELAQTILEDSGYIGSYFLPQTELEMEKNSPPRYKDVEAEGRVSNIKELINALQDFENLQGFLEHVSLVLDNLQDDNTEKVSIMTLHQAKGMEYTSVFLPGWEDGLFPSIRSMEEAGQQGLEEERRLAYVGVTRAEEICTISFASNRLVFRGDQRGWQSQMPSRFIDELPEEHVEVLTPPGLYGGGYGAAAPSAGLGGGIETRAAEANVYNSPGWKRLQARSGERGLSHPKETRNSVIDATAISAFTMGERVFHQKFGYGAIIGIEGDKLEIDFEKAGIKKVVSSYVSASDDIPF